MEVGLVLQANTDMNRDYPEDDDVFYAEIREQILLLTADDGEDSPEAEQPNKKSFLKKKVLLSMASEPGNSIGWWESEDSNFPVPAWLERLWKSGNGTGVFIPEMVNIEGNPGMAKTKGNPKAGKTKSSGRRKVYRQVQKKHA